jgi:hypothetical protein
MIAMVPAETSFMRLDCPIATKTSSHALQLKPNRPSKAKDAGAPGQSATHRLKQEELARLDATVLHALVERKGN